MQGFRLDQLKVVVLHQTKTVMHSDLLKITEHGSPFAVPTCGDIVFLLLLRGFNPAFSSMQAQLRHHFSIKSRNLKLLHRQPQFAYKEIGRGLLGFQAILHGSWLCKLLHSCICDLSPGLLVSFEHALQNLQGKYWQAALSRAFMERLVNFKQPSNMQQA